MYYGKWQLKDLRVASGPFDRCYDLVVDLAILAVEGRRQIVGQNHVEGVRVLAGRPVDARVVRAGSEDVGPRGQIRSVGTAHGALAVARISLFYPAYLGIAADGDVDACKDAPPAVNKNCQIELQVETAEQRLIEFTGGLLKVGIYGNVNNLNL